jgi:polyhydroxybutyrate depolymerase
MLHFTPRQSIQLLLFLFSFSFTNCQKSDPGNVFRFNGQMTVDGRSRTYLLNLPPCYYDTQNLSLVIVLHGFGGSASQAERDYGVTEKGNAGGFIVVYPEGITSNGAAHLRSWNTGACCGPAQTNNVDDIHYISLLIDKMIAEYKVNPKKVYVAGMSNGAMMAYTLACDLSNKIAAITSVSGTLMRSSPCNPLRAVPILHIHSILDTMVPYYGGRGLGGYNFTPIDSTMSTWVRLNSCEAPVVTNYNGFTFTGWKDHSSTTAINLYLTQDGGHSWPGGEKPREQADEPSTVINATDLLWNFFKQYSLQ